MAGVLHHYSSRESLVEGLRKLTRLPQRKVLERGRSRPAKLIRRPTSGAGASIIADYLSGQTIRSIGKSMGFHRETVSAVLHRAEIPTRYHQRTPVDLNRADQLIAGGLTITETAAVLGIGRATLVKARRGSPQHFKLPPVTPPAAIGQQGTLFP